mgnify:CR=1 FL=1
MNLVFLVDVSGSMDQADKLGLAKQSLRTLVASLGAGDSVALVTYAGSTEVVLPATSGAEHRAILAAIERLRADGSTAMGSGLELAYQQARARLSATQSLAAQLPACDQARAEFESIMAERKKRLEAIPGAPR